MPLQVDQRVQTRPATRQSIAHSFVVEALNLYHVDMSRTNLRFVAMSNVQFLCYSLHVKLTHSLIHRMTRSRSKSTVTRRHALQSLDIKAPRTHACKDSRGCNSCQELLPFRQLHSLRRWVLTAITVIWVPRHALKPLACPVHTLAFP